MMFTLRDLRETDAVRMLEWISNPEIVRYLNIDSHQYDIDKVKKFISQALCDDINVHKAIIDVNDRYYGTVSLKNVNMKTRRAEYAISLHPDGIGRGAATDATNAILDFAFQKLKLKSVFLNVASDNTRAVRFYEKTGFKKYRNTFRSVKGIKRSLIWYRIDSPTAN